MRDLIILGAGPHAHEMADIVQQVNRVAPTWNLRGFLVPENQAERVGTVVLGDYRVLGTYATANQYADALFLPEYGCGASDFPRAGLASLVAPSAFVASTARIGQGCVVYPGCFVGHNAVLGDRVFVLSGSIINHDDCLEDSVSLCSHVSLAGSVHVETQAYLGQACTVRQNLRIGRNSLVGMGSVVVADVPPNVIMVGNPARILRDRNP